MVLERTELDTQADIFSRNGWLETALTGQPAKPWLLITAG